MDKKEFFENYNRLTGAEETYLFFIYKNDLYLHTCKHINEDWARTDRDSKKNGGGLKYRMRLKVATKKELLEDTNTRKVMTKAEFLELPVKNKGDKCELYLEMLNGNNDFKHNSVRFDKGGDVEIDGKQVQVKFENASITSVATLEKVMQGL